MTDQITKHKFDFKLPMFPNQRVGDNGMPCELKMDGQDMRGVTSLCVKAGSNGFTNVAIEMEASAALELAGALILNVEGNYTEHQDLMLAQLYNEALEHTESRHDPEEFYQSYEAKADFVRKLISLGIENIK